MKIAVNKCYGGFGLSLEAYLKFCELLNKTPDPKQLAHAEKCGSIFSWHPECENGMDIKRHDTALIQAIEAVGCEAASGPASNVQIVEIADGTEYEIDECDGFERVVRPIEVLG